MTRMEEYSILNQELEQTPDTLNAALHSAKKRLTRRRLLTRPVMGLFGVFAAFVLLVNISPPVAEACARIPFLRELANAVNFSTSLTAAVENQYVQPVNLKQEENDITASVEYLIVDQKQVNVFFRLESDIYKTLQSFPRVRAEDGSALSCSYGQNYHSNIGFGDELQSLNINFHLETVPSSLQVSFEVYEDTNQPEPLAVFTFLLEFDPLFTATGKIHTVNQTVVLDGQTITVTDIEIYPSNLRLNIEEDLNNTAWLKSLSFYLEDEHGNRFGRPQGGIISTGMLDMPYVTSYYAESPYFYDSKSFKLVITDATWLDKDMERIRVDLNAGTVDRLPQGVELLSVRQQGDDWYLSFEVPLREGEPRQAFFFDYYDAEGNKCTLDSISHHSTDEGSEDLTLVLTDYPYGEVWLCPDYSYDWFAQEPITVPLI